MATVTYSFSFFSTIDASDLAIFRIPPSSCQTDGGPLPKTWEEWPFRITPEVASSFRTIFNPELRGAAIFILFFYPFQSPGLSQNQLFKMLNVYCLCSGAPQNLHCIGWKKIWRYFFIGTFVRSLCAVTLDGRLCHNPCCYTIVGSFTSRGDWSCDICLLCVRWQVWIP